ncbi:MAG: BPSS1780 family membrane protein [Betaproteobacteria bacterium]
MQVVDSPPRAGRAWITAAWAMFLAQPGGWISLLACWMVLSLFVTVIVPGVGGVIVTLVQPAFFAGFVIAARDQEAGLPVTFSRFFAGFHVNGRALVALGGITLLSRTLLVIATLPFTFPEYQPIPGTPFPNIPAFLEELGLVHWLVLGALVLVRVIVDGLLWFATPLLALHNMRVSHAIRWSFYAFIGNFMAMLVFTLLLIAIIFVATIPLGLGLLIATPVMALAHYTSYRQVFRDNIPAEAVSPAPPPSPE